MSKSLREAMTRMSTSKMFSPSAWKRVHAILSALPYNASNEDLGEGFIEFIEIWYHDNGIDYYELGMEINKKIENKLLDRWVDCLEND